MASSQANENRCHRPATIKPAARFDVDAAYWTKFNLHGATRRIGREGGRGKGGRKEERREKGGKEGEREKGGREGEGGGRVEGSGEGRRKERKGERVGGRMGRGGKGVEIDRQIDI